MVPVLTGTRRNMGCYMPSEARGSPVTLTPPPPAPGTWDEPMDSMVNRCPKWGLLWASPCLHSDSLTQNRPRKEGVWWWWP